MQLHEREAITQTATSELMEFMEFLIAWERKHDVLRGRAHRTGRAPIRFG